MLVTRRRTTAEGQARRQEKLFLSFLSPFFLFFFFLLSCSSHSDSAFSSAGALHKLLFLSFLALGWRGVVQRNTKVDTWTAKRFQQRGKREDKQEAREGRRKMKDTTTDFGFSCGFPSSVDDWVCTEAPFAPKRHTDDQSGKMEMFKVQHVADQRFKSRGQGQGREEKRNILFTRGLNKKMKLIIFFFFFSVVFQMRAF